MSMPKQPGRPSDVPHAPPAQRMGDACLVADGVLVGFDATLLMPPVDWRIARGEVWALVGDNGSGKTTLLRTLLGLHKTRGGTVTSGAQIAIAYMAQRQGLDAAVPMRVIDYVAGGAEQGWSFLRWGAVAAVRSRALALAETLGFVALLKRPVHALSEGQKQRVALGRALMTRPDMLVLDEPTSAMDMATESDLLARLGELAQTDGMAILVVGHHLPALLRAATHWAWARGTHAGLVTGPRAALLNDAAFMARYGAVCLDLEGRAGSARKAEPS